MSLNNVLIIPFVLCVWILYYSLPRGRQWLAVCLANIVFIILGGGISSLLFLVFTVITVFVYALRIEKLQDRLKIRLKECETREEKKALKEKNKKRLNAGMILVLGLNFGVWYGFKLMERFQWSFSKSHGFWMPLAISFYTFIAVGYLIDVYRGKYKAQRNVVKLFTFVSYFPQLTEGPFARYEDAEKENGLFTVHKFSWTRFEAGVFRILWGYCKKMIIADTLWVTLQQILTDDYEIYAPSVVLLIVLLPFQQYIDFSGCMDIVLGIGHVMGIDLRENFRQPEFSKSIAEVWRRWHITLCEWFKDYLFYPIATNKTVTKLQKKIKRISPTAALYMPSIVAMFAIWTITGLWHGATANDVLWGWMNFAILSTSLVLEKTYKKFHVRTGISADSMGWKWFSIARTIILFGIMEIMADVESATQAFRLYRSLVTPINWTVQATTVGLLPGMEVTDFIKIALFGVVVIWIDVQKEKNVDLKTKFVNLPVLLKMILFVGLFYALVLLAESDIVGSFAYAQY